MVVYVRVPAACPFTNKLVFREEETWPTIHTHVRKIKISLQKPLLTWNSLSLFPWERNPEITSLGLIDEPDNINTEAIKKNIHDNS